LLSIRNSSSSRLRPSARRGTHRCNAAQRPCPQPSTQLGSIEPGKIADLVLLAADPLADIRNTRKIALVIRGGIVGEPSALFKLVPAE
jgi:hypothetical protein